MSNSKFDYEYITNGYDDCVVVNKNKYSIKEAIRIAQEELFNYGDISDTLNYFESHAQYGFYVHWNTGELINGWHIESLYEPAQNVHKNSIPVWIIKAY